MVTKYGRRRAILWSNLAICVITVPYFFMLNIWVLSITRFCLGVLSAVIINGTALYISEAVPAKYRTQVGSAVNFGIVFGIWIMGVFGLFMPTLTDPQACMDDNLWRVSYSFQLVPVFITSIAWLFVLKSEPLKYLMAQAEQQGGTDS